MRCWVQCWYLSVPIRTAALIDGAGRHPSTHLHPGMLLSHLSFSAAFYHFVLTVHRETEVKVLVICLKGRTCVPQPVKATQRPHCSESKDPNLELGFQGPSFALTWVWKLRLRGDSPDHPTCLEMAELDSNPGLSGSVPGLSWSLGPPKNTASRAYMPLPGRCHSWKRRIFLNLCYGHKTPGPRLQGPMLRLPPALGLPCRLGLTLISSSHLPHICSCGQEPVGGAGGSDLISHVC